MKNAVLGCVLVFVFTCTANAAWFTEEWTNYNMGHNTTSASFGPDGYVPIGSIGDNAPKLYYMSNGDPVPGIPPKLPNTGLDAGGYFGGIQVNAAGKYFGMRSLGSHPNGALVTWANVTATPVEVNYNGSFARNMFLTGDRMYTVGHADGGHIEILDPDPVTGDYNVTYTLGDPAGDPGGKADVAAKQDGSIVWGIEGLRLPGDNGLSQWSYNAGTDSYDFDGVIDYVAALGIGRSVGMGYDEDDNIMFLGDFDNEAIHGIDMGTDAVGDESLIATWSATGVNFHYYAGVRVDGANNELYWGFRDQPAAGTVGHIGKLSYVPEPGTLALLAFGGLALIRRR